MCERPTYEEFVEALHEAPEKITLSIPLTLLITLIAQLQLALRHPQNPSHTAAATRQFIDDVRERLPEPLQQIIDAGNNPELDVP